MRRREYDGSGLRGEVRGVGGGMFAKGVSSEASITAR